MNRGELVAELASTLGARHEARFIVDEVLGSATAVPDEPVTADDAEAARDMASRRAAGEPLQYVCGHWAFRTLDLLVDPRVLIPRPETEQVVDVAMAELAALAPQHPVIVDAGTGSGAIALSMATEMAGRFPTALVWATDVSPDALSVAAANLERVRAQHGAILPVHLVEGNWLEHLPPDLKSAVSVVVSNPPYIGVTEWADLPADVRCEPRHALLAASGSDGTPGLGDVETVLHQAWEWLARPGAVIVELAPHQADAALVLARDIGYCDVSVEPDLAGRARALVGRLR